MIRLRCRRPKSRKALPQCCSCGEMVNMLNLNYTYRIYPSQEQQALMQEWL
jgi:hypothetical protein